MINSFQERGGGNSCLLLLSQQKPRNTNKSKGWKCFQSATWPDWTRGFNGQGAPRRIKLLIINYWEILGWRMGPTPDGFTATSTRSKYEKCKKKKKKTQSKAKLRAWAEKKRSESISQRLFWGAKGIWERFVSTWRICKSTNFPLGSQFCWKTSWVPCTSWGQQYPGVDPACWNEENKGARPLKAAQRP